MTDNSSSETPMLNPKKRPLDNTEHIHSYAMKNRDPYGWVIGLVVLISRIMTSGPVYWADGPAHIRAIQSHVYIIEPPGYWLLNRSASLFSHAAAGLHILNWSFSALGVATFYLVAKRIVSRRVARLGTAVYAAVFYIWFSGGVHSSYASQIFFPVLMFYFFLRYRESSRLAHLIGASVAFAVGAGFRPSDGAFLLPLFVYFVVRYAPWRQLACSFALVFVICMGWLVPTYCAYSRASAGGVGKAVSYVPHIMTVASVLHNGVTRQSMANVARYWVPLIAAFWPISYALMCSLKRIKEERTFWLWLWIVPGSLFFNLIYISDATYLNFLTAAIVLLVLIVLDGKWQAVPLLATCLVFNMLLFLFFVPLPSRKFPVEIFDAYVGRYTLYGIRHQWWPNLGVLMSQGK